VGIGCRELTIEPGERGIARPLCFEVLPMIKEDVIKEDDRLAELDEDECRELLGHGTVGRVGVTVGGLPMILPVNYGWVDGDILFRTGDGTKLKAAVDRAVIAFEVDAYDVEHRAGWSVLAIGRAFEVLDPVAVAAAESLALAPWANGNRHHWVRMRPELISGRRIEEIR
jgi:nitroimidazol reductase NimA-like FMN-containing flavoprotein (pyridoxamine 5'-phosphate oxidase superfamily)